jgi:hypothetical protein
MHERPGLRRRAPIGVSCMSGSGGTALGDYCYSLGGRGRVGFLTAGIWRGVWRAPRGSMLRVNLHSSAIERICAGLAVLRVPYMRSTARPRGIGSVVELCMPSAPRPVPGTTAPPQVPAVIPEWRDPAPGETDAPPQVPAVKNPIRPKTTEESGTTPVRHGRPAERRRGCGALGIRASRSASVPRLTRRPRHRPEDAERSEAPKTSRPGARPSGTRRRSPSPPGP